MSLSILIPSLDERVEQRYALIDELWAQVKECNLVGKVEILTEIDNRKNSIGWKRNRLLERAEKEYVCFIDDDDIISSNYIKDVFEGIKLGVDCCSLRGVITWDGTSPDV